MFDTRLGAAAIAGTGEGVIIRCDLPASDPDEMVEAIAVATGLVPREADREPIPREADGSLIPREADRGPGPREDDGPDRTDEALEAAIRAIGEFLEGESCRIKLDLDWRLCSAFTRRILEATIDIPFGETLSYGEVAAEAGHPGAHRAAGTALSKNPFALIIPCHRVIRADGDPGDYGRGEEGRRLKRALLDLEAGPT